MLSTARRLTLGVLLALLALGGCSEDTENSGASASTDANGAVGSDSSSGSIETRPADVSGGWGTEVVEPPDGPVPGSDAGAVDAGTTGDGEPAQAAGEFGAPCGTNTDCLSGWCVEGAEGYICTKPCEDECPDGFDCKSVQTSGSDLAFLCLPRLEKLCTPCTSALQCTGGACLSVDGEGRCGYICEEDSDCPQGYGCLEDNSGTEDGTFCQPLTGSCTCVADFDGGQRSCSVSGDLGTCYGVATCDPETGWGKCSASEPSPEECDGLDNDCNGLIDDALEAGLPCENSIEGIGSCQGVQACFGPQGWLCQGPLPEPEVCDYKDNDCDGSLDETFKDVEGNWTLDGFCGGCAIDCSQEIVGGTGYCAGNADAPVCAVESCEPGYVKVNEFQCGLQPDVSCQPCTVDSDCFAGSCLELDGQPACVIPCELDTKACPQGYSCDDIGGGVERCMPLTGSCACTSANEGQLRTCLVQNDVGICYGVETCEPADGWVDCTAVAAEMEICDGLDNDCNGIVDDGLIGQSSCANSAEGIGSCEGVEVCLGPQGWNCQGPIPELESCDFADNDCDEAVDEDFRDADGYWTLNDHCGTCGNTCDGKIANGTAVCGGSPEAPVCVVSACDEGYIAINDFQCAIPPDVACQPCGDDAACFQGSCVAIDGANVCLEPCKDDGSCYDGFSCVTSASGALCEPISGSCSCDTSTAGVSRPCQVGNDIGNCLGQEICNGAEGWGPCSAAEATEEVCDGVDNDCNGFVDEVEEVGSACSNAIEGVGACSGTLYCLGEEGLVCQAAEPEVESCDFQDNDCDGDVDEDFKDPSGNWTLDGHCGTCGNSCLENIANGTGTCGGTADAPVCVVATCDDGFAKINDFQCEVPPDVACQACATDDDCFEGTCVDLDGDFVCLMPCDEGSCKDGYACDESFGEALCLPQSGSCACSEATAGQIRACQRANDIGTCLGTEACDPAVGWTGCTALVPAEETCDGADNDCNGAIDDALAQQGEPCENTVEGLGSCDGVSICSGLSGWSCQGPEPVEEACNFKDDDCDGSTDEAFKDEDGAWTLDAHCGTCGNDCEDKLENATGVCGGSTQSPVCVVSSCDDGFVQLNDFQCIIPPDVSCQPCAGDDVCVGGSCVELDGQSVCAMDCDSDLDCVEEYGCEEVGGAKLCVPTSGSCSCSSENAGAKRSCASTNDAGACYGAETCDPDTGWSACDASTPSGEVCDGVDNDCNGIVDDGLEEGGLCFNDLEGVGSCSGQQLCIGEWTCQGQLPEIETCNFKDDDCDDAVDEDFKVDGAWLQDSHCGTCGNDCLEKIENGVGACGGSALSPVCVVASCDEGYVKINDFQCTLPPDVSCQACDVDDDCYNGVCEVVDDQAVCLPPCGADGLCADGYICEAGTGGFERCVPVTGSCSCNTSTSGAKRTCELSNAFGACFGVETCDGELGWSACSAAAPEEEVCDGYDQDCDGFIDEEVPAGYACENTVEGVGSCEGVAACFGSQGMKCQGSVPTEETCDYQDNDCDGTVDEDFVEGDVYASFEHCGACNTSCAIGFPNATATACEANGSQAQCVVETCEDGYAKINAFQCIPDVANICQACSTDDNCLGESSACLSLAEGSFCGKGCSSGDDCPSGFACQAVEGVASLQCVPATGSCSCDGTNTSLAVACDQTFTPEDENQPAYTCNGIKQCTTSGWGPCELPVEACDGIDNNCDGLTDEPYKNEDGVYHTVNHCGDCGASCLALEPPNASATCEIGGLVPQCGFVCDEGWSNVNGLSDDGCECAPQPGPDVATDGVDSNCDGIIGDINKALFVAKNGSDSATGIWGDPMLTIQAALDKAQQLGKRDVYVATGVYSQNIELVEGVGLFAGYSADFESRDPLVYETAIIGQSPTEERPGAVNIVSLGLLSSGAITAIDGFTIFGPSAANSPSANSYAIYVSNSGANVYIQSNRIFGGAGGNGLAGTAGADGNDGTDGVEGIGSVDLPWSGGNRTCSNNSDASAGGAGGDATCSDGTNLSGGDGGDGRCPTYGSTPPSQSNGENGQGESAGIGGSGGYAGEHDSNVTCSSCFIPGTSLGPMSGGAGTNGLSGSAGNAGLGCSLANGLVSDGHWIAGAGTEGDNGVHGSGGGGGGAGGGVEVSGTGCSGFGGDDIGGSGGGGGAGGCLGFGGDGGVGGGGSFGIFVVHNSANNVPVIDGNTIRPGSGGAGGSGGPGGAGGNAGLGALGGPRFESDATKWCAKGGGVGGNGGSGGAGGGGGGGCGGASFGIFLWPLDDIGGASNWEASNVFEAGGAGGYGGPGGASLGQSGSQGVNGTSASMNF